MSQTTARAATLSLEARAHRRFPLGPLALRMGISLLVDGLEGGQQPGQPLESQAELAARLEVSMRTVRRWMLDPGCVLAGAGGRHRSGPHRGGLSVVQADRYAVRAGFMPWQVWLDWWDDVPTEEELFSRGCRCRPDVRRPIRGACDRCGGSLRVAA